MKNSTKETYVAYIAEDFEPGDRIFHYTGLNKGTLGRVDSVRDNCVIVEMDDGTFEAAPIALFDEDSPLWEWDKLVDIDDLELGSRLSRTEWGIRIFAHVVKFVPNKEIVLEYEFPVTQIKGVEATQSVLKAPVGRPDVTLQHLLLGWHLEG
jgi:hypothetical protein